MDYTNCEAYFKGEVRPIIFEVYTESGVPFELIDDSNTPQNEFAYCEVKTSEQQLLSHLPVTLISNEPAKKVMLCSWDTTLVDVGYYTLQVWVLLNLSGSVDDSGNPIVEGKLASEQIVRYIKE